MQKFGTTPQNSAVSKSLQPAPMAGLAPSAIPSNGPVQCLTDGEAMLDAMVATGMSASDALMVIGGRFPALAAETFDRTWPRLLAQGDAKFDLCGAEWLTHLPEGLRLPDFSVLDISGCRNFRSLPMSLMLGSHSSLRLEGSGWDRAVAYPENGKRYPHWFDMHPGAVITYTLGEGWDDRNKHGEERIRRMDFEDWASGVGAPGIKLHRFSSNGESCP